MQRPKLLDLQTLKLNALPTSVEKLLTADAFKLPARKIEAKEEAIPSITLPDGFTIPIAAYTKLYGKQKPIWGYKKIEAKETTISGHESKDPNIDPKLYKQQLLLLIEAIKKWGAQINPTTRQSRINAANLANLDVFKANFFQPDYSGDQTPAYFISLKNALEKIWYMLTQSDAVHEKDKTNELNSLCEKIGFCNTGVYTYICDTAFQLTKDASLEFLLAQMRKNITDAYTSAYRELNKNLISVGSEVHISTALYSYSKNQNWGPLVDITKIVEKFGAQLTLVDAEVYTNFHKYFERSYSPCAIVTAIYTHINSELSKHKNLLLKTDLEKEDKDGWIPYNQEFYDQTVLLINSIGCEWEDFFDKSEDYKIKFDSHLFTLRFLKHCWQKKILFQADQWRVIQFGDGYSAYCFSDQFSWIEKPDKSLLDIESLASENDRYDLLIRIASIEATDAFEGSIFAGVMVETTTDFSALGGYITRLLEPIKTGADLFKLLARSNDKKVIKTLIEDIISKITLHDIIATDVNFFPSLDALPMSEKWKTDIIIGFCDKDFLFSVAFEGNVTSLKRLVSDAKLSPLALSPAQFSLAHYAARYNHANVIHALAEYKGFNFNDTSNPGGFPAIRYATKLNSVDVMKALYEYKAELNIRGKDDEWTPIQIAVSHGHVEAFHFLADKVDLSQVNSKGETLAHIALYNKNPNPILMIEALGKHQIAFNKKNSAGLSPLVVAVNKEKYKLVVAMSKYTSAKRLFAVLKIKTDIIKHLAEAGMDFSAKGTDDTSLISLAMKSRKWELANQMLRLECKAPNNEEALINAALQKKDLSAIKTLAPFYDLSKYIFKAVDLESTDIINTLIECKLDLTNRRFFIPNDPNILRHGNKWLTLQEHAVKLGNITVIKTLLDHKLDFVSPTYAKSTLDLATSKNRWDILSLLLEIKPATVEEANLSFLKRLVQRGNIIDIKKILDHKINPIDDLGNTIAHYAVFSHRPEIIDLLQEYNTDFTIMNRIGESALTYAIEKDDRIIADKMLQLHISKEEASIPITHIAAKRGHVIAIPMLAANKIKDKEGNTQLHLAAQFNKIDNLKEFKFDLEDCKERNVRNETPIQIALENKRWDITAALLKVKRVGDSLLHDIIREGNSKVLDVFLQHKYDGDINIEGENKEGYTPAEFAIQKNDLECIRVLAKHGADFTKRSLFNNKPHILTAYRRERFEVVNAILMLDSSTNFYPLPHRVVLSGNYKAIKILHDLGVNLTVKDSLGWTAADHAADCKYYSMLQLFIDYKAAPKPIEYYVDKLFQPNMHYHEGKDMVCYFAEKGVNFAKILNNPHFAVMVLTELKDPRKLNIETLKKLNSARKELTKAFIESVKNARVASDGPSQQRTMLHSVLDKQNVLGIILSTPVSDFRFSYTDKRYLGKPVTGSIYKIIQEFKALLGNEGQKFEDKGSKDKGSSVDLTIIQKSL